MSNVKKKMNIYLSSQSDETDFLSCWAPFYLDSYLGPKSY